ncbi:MAG: rod shape-determining protein MreD [Nitrospina sp.]|jgi:rod shape-determining protein MreD|nr:rod shape-determining protein MreD [Nitrospina sp.]MBT5632292.1 rod shape-determining protein MreD [Nitrospina sp.]
MYFYAQALIIVFLFSAQTTWLELFSFGGVIPDLVLIWVVYCAVRHSRTAGIGAGITMGLIQDSLSGGLLGVNTLSKGLIGYFFSTLKDKFFVEGMIPVGIFLILSSVFDGLVFYFSMGTILKGEIASSFLYQSLPVYSIYNGLIGPLVFMVLDKIDSWLQSKKTGLHMRTTN